MKLRFKTMTYFLAIYWLGFTQTFIWNKNNNFDNQIFLPCPSKHRIQIKLCNTMSTTRFLANSIYLNLDSRYTLSFAVPSASVNTFSDIHKCRQMCPYRFWLIYSVRVIINLVVFGFITILFWIDRLLVIHM